MKSTAELGEEISISGDDFSRMIYTLTEYINRNNLKTRENVELLVRELIMYEFAPEVPL